MLDCIDSLRLKLEVDVAIRSGSMNCSCIQKVIVRQSFSMIMGKLTEISNEQITGVPNGHVMSFPLEGVVL